LPGQGLVEYALLVAVLAVACLVALFFLGDAATRAYRDIGGALDGPVSVTAPSATPAPGVPTNPEQCKNGGWQAFGPPAGPFQNQGDCQSWANAHP
jgi:Flp pilus assembly pilin Flp